MNTATSRPARIGLVNPSHWHFEFYLPGIYDSGATIVGYTEVNRASVMKIENRSSAPYFENVERLVASTCPDFVFAFGEHANLPVIATKLIDLGVPFSIEKPGGLSAAAVAQIAKRAEDVNLFVSVPFHYRVSDFWRTVENLDLGSSDDIRKLQIDVIARTPKQHVEGSPWLTEYDRAGGGAAINLAHHPIDFTLALVGRDILEVRAQASNATLGLDVEDEFKMQLSFISGAEANIRASYNHPLNSDSHMGFEFELEHERFTATLKGDRLAITPRSGAPSLEIRASSVFKKHFADYANLTVVRALTAGEPIASLRDLEQTMKVIDAGYAAAASGAVQSMKSFS